MPAFVPVALRATVTSFEHGFLKPHPSIFSAALQLVDVEPADAVMVGDSLKHDVEGAMRAGMSGVLLHRGHGDHPGEAELAARGVRVIRSLDELPRMVIEPGFERGIG